MTKDEFLNKYWLNSETPESKADLILSKWSLLAIAEDVRGSLRVHIAAALREAQQDGYIKGWTAGNEHEDALDAEIAKLKARISEQEGQIDRADEHTAKIMTALEDAERERDAAIQIEIDNKAKAGKT